MKKNKMMRLASAMMVMTLMTTSVISGTFAKYVTQDSAQDKARVAKFGVVVEAEGTLFNDEYEKTSSIVGGEDTLSVVSKTEGENVVAPGTENVGEITFSIKGAPEVDVKVDFEFIDLGEPYDNDIYLAASDADKYPDMTTGDADAFALDETYYPIKYTLKRTKVDASEEVLCDGGNLSDLRTALTTAFATTYFDANTDLGKEAHGEYTITWEWPFAGNDSADTLLGNLMADTTIVKTAATAAAAEGAVEPTHYNLATGIGFKITVTQID